MKIVPMLAALGLAAAVIPLGASVNAQPYRGNHWQDGRWDRGHNGRGWDRHDRRWNNRGYYAYGYGNRYGYRHNDYRPRCWTEWRHHRNVRVCR